MGGCRCIFRNCLVSTARHPRMHFFHFPTKDAVRLLKWVEMAGVPHIMQMPVAQQRNKVVCARHFRDECFMNYMKDKLVATAVPTLERMKGGFALDYSAGDEPKIILVPKPTTEHMIAPASFQCPLDLDDTTFEPEEFIVMDIAHKEENTSQQKMVVKDLDDSQLLELIEPMPEKLSIETVVAPQKRKISVAGNEVGGKKPKILNIQAPGNVLQIDNDELSSTSALDFIRKDSIQFINLSEDDNFLVDSNSNTALEYFEVVDEGITESNVRSKTFAENAIQIKEFLEIKKTNKQKNILQRQHSAACEQFEGQLQKERSKYANYQEDTSKQIAQLQEKLQAANRRLEDNKMQLDELKLDNAKLTLQNEELGTQHADQETKIENLNITNHLYKSRLEELTQSHEDLVETMRQLEAKNIALQQVSTVSTSKDPSLHSTVGLTPISGAGVSTAATQLSKAQLFNGIKKYMSSSMVALVRMEMFGSTERAWKPDEKQASLDLLRLGENVYRYLTDEWRFRLPGLRQVREWLSQASMVMPDDEEDL